MEAKSLNKKYGGTLWTHKQATKINYEAKAQNYNVILLATHSFALNEDPEHSFIAFSEKDDKKEDELMVVSEVYSQVINADLVVLSSCESAKGKLLRGEGLMNIAQAFFRSGARSIVAALWNVSDEQAPKIIETYFENLDKGSNKSKALQIAQTSYFETSIGLKSHPFYWAGFNSFHNDDAIQFSSQTSIYIWGLGLLIIILLGFVGKKLLQA